ncbi:NFX1-type zinc finger-containing protein 1 [Termitomyces sp. T112]|nr:NFX1-type zinc finger-containing protein 1 [Termitomyces sp. T112]
MNAGKAYVPMTTSFLAPTSLAPTLPRQAVKESIDNLITLVDQNYQRELHGRTPLDVSLNRVFIGSPGTGKTTVATLYGQILADLGLLSNGEVMVKNPSDFIGSVLGESESRTKAILATSVGKVLIIDEAYMLYGGSGGAEKNNDLYKTAVIDTLVAEIQSVPGDDRCVLLLGYKDQMLEMFQNVNPELSRRFAIEDAFNFEDFNDEQLLEILNSKLNAQDLSATDAAKEVAIEILGRLRNRPNFGNGGEVENLITKAKQNYQGRASKTKGGFSDIVFESQDFDHDYDRAKRAISNLSKLFEDVVGCERIVERLEDYQRLAAKLKSRNIDDRSQIPTNFVFKGPPGTGKTTIARKMGQVYYDMGLLSSPEVIECSASDLVGRYVEETGPKTKQLLEKALGRVLSIE